MADKPCTFEGCEQIGQLRRGYCKRHYRRLMAHGDPSINTQAPEWYTLPERLFFTGWDVVSGPLDTDCWEWKGNKRRGYGRVSMRGVAYQAHRVSYEHFVGSVPDGLMLRHKCDNPPCINPEHLTPGNAHENALDMLERGRQNPPVGSRNGQALLTDAKVWGILNMRAATNLSYKEIADEVGMSMAMVAFICQGKRWVHVYKPWRLAHPEADLRTRG